MENEMIYIKLEKFCIIESRLENQTIVIPFTIFS